MTIGDATRVGNLAIVYSGLRVPSQGGAAAKADYAGLRPVRQQERPKGASDTRSPP
jgi:hypothetical protein